QHRRTERLNGPPHPALSPIGKNRLLAIFSRPYTVSGSKKRGFCCLPRRAPTSEHVTPETSACCAPVSLRFCCWCRRVPRALQSCVHALLPAPIVPCG